MALTDADTATQSIVNIIFYMRFKRPALEAPVLNLYLTVLGLNESASLSEF